MQRDGEHGQQSVIGVLFQQRHDFLGWVVFILSQPPVQNRSNHISNKERQRQPGLMTKQGVRSDAQKRHEGISQRGHPEIAFGVGVGHVAGISGKSVGSHVSLYHWLSDRNSV